MFNNDNLKELEMFEEYNLIISLAQEEKNMQKNIKDKILNKNNYKN